jgi:hypothetical protein
MDFRIVETLDSLRVGILPKKGEEFFMKIVCNLPPCAYLAFRGYVNGVMTGVVDGWIHLPPSIQMLVVETRISQRGDDERLSVYNFFEVEVELAFDLADGSKLKYSATLEVKDFSDGINRRTEHEFRTAVLGTVERAAKVLQEPDRRKVETLLL